MKYLKIYETFKSNYKIGDYILVKDILNHRIYNYVKIIEIDDDMYIPYHCLFSNNDKIWVLEDRIVRKLTSEEIKKYEMESNARKYNI